MVFTIVNRKDIINDLKNGFDTSQIDGDESSTNEKKIPLNKETSTSLISNDFCNQYVLLKRGSKKYLNKVDIEN